jgi:hypothetical protein
MEAKGMIRTLLHKRAMLLLPFWLLGLLAGWQPATPGQNDVSPWLEARSAALEPIQRQLLPTRHWLARESADADQAGPGDSPLVLPAALARPAGCLASAPLFLPAADPARPAVTAPYRARAPPLV